MTAPRDAALRAAETAQTVAERKARAAQRAARQAAKGENPGLPPSWRTMRKQDDEYMAGARRFILAAGTRGGDSDPDQALPELVGLHETVEQALLIAVVGWRRAGYSWIRIGAAVGISKTAARVRWSEAVAAFEAAEQESVA